MEKELAPFADFCKQVERLGFNFQLEEIRFIYEMAEQAARFGLPYTHVVSKLGSSPIKCTLDCNLYAGNGITGFEARLYGLPEFEPATLEKFAISKLEEQFQACSWTLERQNWQYLPELYGSLLQLMSLNSKTKSVGESLMLKYWLDTPVEKYLDLTPVKLKYRRKEYFQVAGNHTDFTLLEAEALLMGRPVFKGHAANKLDPLQGEWTQLTFYSDQGTLAKDRDTYPGYDIASLLNRLPYEVKPSEQELAGTLGLIMVGKSVPISLVIGSNSQLVLLTADPKSKGIILQGRKGLQVCITALTAKDMKRLELELGNMRKDQQTRKPDKRKGLGL